MKTSLPEWASARGYEAAWGPMDVLAEVWLDFDRRRREGQFDPRFDAERLSWFEYPSPLPVEDARSVLVIAVPRPAHVVTFLTVRGRLEAVVPPTYVTYDKTREAVRQELSRTFMEGNGTLEVLVSPLKAVAARLGLIRYGYNNVGYSARFGSYIQLMGFVSDVDPPAACELLETEAWGLPTCESCGICRGACPTGAIAEERFLLRGERCLTYHSEAERPWPDDVATSVHHCLIGCMRCQEVCPYNQGLLVTEPTGVTFSKDETNAILAGVESSRESLRQSVESKLRMLGMEQYLPVLGRNLKALLDQRL